MDINQVIENNASESVTSNADQVENNDIYYFKIYSVSSLVVPKMEDEFSGTDAEKNSKWHDKSW